MSHSELPITIKIRAEREELLPTYASKGASGADLRANIATPLTISPGAHALVPTGIYCEIPHGLEIQVRPRSGLALKHQLTVLNSPGTIDSDYRGEIQVILINLGSRDFLVEPLMRIAQIVIARTLQAAFELAGELGASERGAGGFGHTGLH
jgi:dUTP pyrophosphatase